VTSAQGDEPPDAGGRPAARPRTSAGLDRGRARVLLAGLLAVQAVLALSAHAGRVFLDDEVGTWRAARGSFADVLTSFDEWQTQPGYFLLAKLCAVPLGPTELALRRRSALRCF